MIRPYTDSDWPSVRDIYDLSKPDEMRGSVDPSVILPFDHDPPRLAQFQRSKIIVAEREGIIEGFGGSEGSEISWIFVHPDHRRKGVATALVDHLLAQIGGEVELNVAEANHPARRLYATLGFAVKEEFEGTFEGVAVRVVRMHHPGERMILADDITIRPLTDSDSIHNLTLLLHRAYKPLADSGWRYWASYQSEDDTRTRITGGRCFVALLKGEIVGTVTCHRRSTWEGSPWMRRSEVANVGQFAVEPGLQGRGVGGLLLDQAEALAREEGATEIALSTAEPANHLIDYYTKRGYRLIETTDATLPQGYRSVILSKRL